MAAVVTHVAIQASLLASGDDDAGAALAVNRLVWGGLRVALVHATSGEELAPPPSALDDRVQHLSAAPPPAEGAAAGDLASWVASRPAPGTLLAVRSCEAQAPWAPQLEAGALLWRVEGSGARCGEQAQPATISCLAQLPACLARHQQTAGQALLGRPVQLVAHCMAAKRERELAGMSSSIPGPGAAEEGGQHAYAGGLLSLVPQRCGLVFMPLDLDGDLDSQLPFQVLLHKASDELQVGQDGRPCFSPRIQRLRRWLADGEQAGRSAIRVVDPIDSAATVIDRVALCQVTDVLSADGPPDPSSSTARAAPAGACQARVRAPRHCVLHAWGDPHAALAAVASAGLQPPWIVKASEACGLPHSHRMALALGPAALPGALRALALRPPVVLQEFRNHGGRVAKVYVAGAQVFHAIKPSIPDVPLPWVEAWAGGARDDAARSADAPPSPEEQQQQPLQQAGFLIFDSLKSLPTGGWEAGVSERQAPGAQHEGQALQRVLQESPGALEAAAKRLRELLGLSLFGFDVIAAPPAGDPRAAAAAELHVIDVNYLPNYRVAGAADHVWRVIAGETQ